MFFKCEMFNNEGKIIEEKHIQISVGGVTDASKDERVIRMRQRAMNMGFGFRVKMEEN